MACACWRNRRQKRRKCPSMGASCGRLPQSLAIRLSATCCYRDRVARVRQESLTGIPMTLRALQEKETGWNPGRSNQLRCRRRGIAADMAVRRDRFRAGPGLHLDGLFHRGNVGGLWPTSAGTSRRAIRRSTPTPASSLGTPFGSHTADGWLGGVQAGCDYQLRDRTG